MVRTWSNEIHLTWESSRQTRSSFVYHENKKVEHHSQVNLEPFESAKYTDTTDDRIGEH